MTVPGDAKALERVMAGLGQAAREASQRMALAPATAKDAALRAAAHQIEAQAAAILDANAKDVAAALDAGASATFLDRLRLNEGRLAAIASGLACIAARPDPVGRILEEWQRPDGLRFQKVATALGVIGLIFESRPNVAVDAGAMCIKSGNAVILRGGSESVHSVAALIEAMRQGLRAAGLPCDAVQAVPVADRAAVGMMLNMQGTIDVLIPRGGKSLTARVATESRIPVLYHLDGICHLYLDARADLDKARAVILNAKMRRTGICGAMETLLVHEAVAVTHLPAILDDLLMAGCVLRGDAGVCALNPAVTPAIPDDWDTEYLDAILSIRLVRDLDEAMAHIATHGSHHTDGIITEDQQAAARFVARVDSAIVLHNASTQFADGGEFGFGGEIGIATGKLHARGPVGAEHLTSYKYIVRGDGHVRTP
jgi:glutamate-5-semialdehyde dehydrogenase